MTSLDAISSTKTPVWSESLEKFDALGNLLEAIVNGKPQTYAYDRFDHLTKDENLMSMTHSEIVSQNQVNLFK